MSGITEKKGIPCVWNVPCVRDTNFNFSSAQVSRHTAWLCPHCLDHLCIENEEMFCSKGCHLVKNANRKSLYSNLYNECLNKIIKGSLIHKHKETPIETISRLALTC